MDGKTVRMRPVGDLTLLDPLAGRTTPSQEAAYMVFDSLYGLDGSLTPQPQMVAGHEVSADGLTWRIALREGLLFHDGEKVLARDAVASVARWMQREPFGLALKSRLLEMRAIDDRQFEIRLRAPFALLPMGLCSNTLFVMPAHVAATTNAFTPSKSYIGSGPFVFAADEWVAGSHAAFRRHDRYVPRAEASSFMAGSRAAFVDRVEYLIMPDTTTAAAALAKGEIDILPGVPIDLVPLLRRASGVTVQQIDPFGQITMLIFNTKAPPFDNPRLRHALLTGVSQSDCMQAVVGDEAAIMRAGLGVFTPGTALASEDGLDLVRGPRDMELTRRLVRESGYQGETVVQLVPTDSQPLFACSNVVVDVMRQAGLKVDFQAMDFGTVLKRRNFGGNQSGWSCYTANINGLAYAQPGTHYSLLANAPDPEIERLTDSWFGAADLSAQSSIARQIQRRFLDAPPFLPLGQYFSPHAFRTGVTGFTPSYLTLFWGLRKA